MRTSLNNGCWPRYHKHNCQEMRTPQMTPERANRLTGGHRWNETNERCVVCLMSRREFDETGEL